jgi:nicotinamide-nucleotide amidase
MAIDGLARELVEHLQRNGLRIVFAESCTGGRVSATLAEIPGVSQYLCGSAVTYRDEVKSQWLGVSSATIAAVTSVSDAVAREMALGVLNVTIGADVALSITGHLGPDAPTDLDGVVFIGYARRRGSESPELASGSYTLKNADRRSRQIEAAETLIKYAVEKLVESG